MIHIICDISDCNGIYRRRLRCQSVIYTKKSKNRIRIKLEKVIMVGSEDFTLAGRPIVPRNIATVDAICVAVNYTESPRVTFYNPRAPRRPGTDFIREKKVILRIEKVSVKPNLS